MAVKALVPVERNAAPIAWQDFDNTQIFGIRDTSHAGNVSSIEPDINLANHNPGAYPIGRTQPPVKVRVINNQLAGSPAGGAISDEDLRQYVYGARLVNGASRYFSTINK